MTAQRRLLSLVSAGALALVCTAVGVAPARGQQRDGVDSARRSGCDG